MINSYASRDNNDVCNATLIINFPDYPKSEKENFAANYLCWTAVLPIFSASHPTGKFHMQ